MIASKILDGNVTTVKIASGAVDTSKIAGNGSNKVLATDGSGIVRWVNKTAVGTSVSDGITITGSGSVGDSLKVKNGGIDSAKLASNALKTIHLTDSSVTMAKIKNKSIDSTKITSKGVAASNINGDGNKMLVSQSGNATWVTRFAPTETAVAGPSYTISASPSAFMLVKVTNSSGAALSVGTYNIPTGKTGTFASTGSSWEIIGLLD